MEHIDFDAVEPSLAEPSGTFVLGGREWRVRNRSDVSVGVLNAFDAQKGTVQVEPFVRGTLHPDDVDAFIALVNDPGGPITTTRLDHICDWIVGLVLNRPTTPASDTSTGSKPTGRKSAAGSSSRATPRRKSA